LTEKTDTASPKKERKDLMMKKEEKKKIYEKSKNAHALDHLRNAVDLTHPASVNDCTGYTPVIPLSAEESESYEDLMDLPAPARYLRHNENI
jgi:hypothetical protein